MKKYLHGVKGKDLEVMPYDCKHGIPLANGLNVCALCRHKQTRFEMRFPFEKWDATAGKFRIISEEEEADNRINDLHLFDHSDFGEPGPGTAAHLATMNGLDRMIAEECVNGTDRINRINPSAGVTSTGTEIKTFSGYNWKKASDRAGSEWFDFEVRTETRSAKVKAIYFTEDRRPHFDRLDTLAGSLGMIRDDKTIDPLAGVILDAFRALELDETARKRLTLEIRKDRTKVHALLEAASEVSKEILPPLPLIVETELDDETEAIAIEEPEEIGPPQQPDMYATPLGDYNQMPYDYTTADNRSAAFRTTKDRIALAVQGDDGKALAQIGKDLYAQVYATSQEKSTLFHLYNVAKGKVECHLEHRFNAMLRRIAEHPTPAKLGKPLFELAKYKGEPMHRTGKEGRPKFTTAQWKAIWEAYRVRVPKAPRPPEQFEQMPLFNYETDLIDPDPSTFFECPDPEPMPEIMPAF